MKDISKQFLIEATKNLRDFIPPEIVLRFDRNSFLPSKENPFISLFYEYSGLEIDSYDKIINATNEFFDFLRSTKDYQCDKVIAYMINHASKIITRKVNRFAYENLGHKFANTVLTLSPTKPENAHILDVGPGIVPYSSLALGQEANKVSAMDEAFLFSNQALASMNVLAIEQFFDQNTNIDDYDFVVGSCPCTAIPYIVQKCKAKNKPYFLILCDCATYSKNIHILDDFAKRKLYTWDKILPELDPQITLFEDYAFNLGDSPELAKRFLSKNYIPHMKRRVPKISADKLVFDASEIQFENIDLSLATWSKE